MAAFLKAQADGVLLNIRLQPRASRNQIGPSAGDHLRIKVTAPPVDSAANEALIRLLAEQFELSRGQIELVRGHASRNKVVKIYGIPNDLIARLIPGR
jgi:uncharacterized protein (TIGR00251 family)